MAEPFAWTLRLPVPPSVVELFAAPLATLTVLLENSLALALYPKEVELLAK